MIIINQLNKSFDGGNTWAVKELSLEIQEGHTLVLLGSSGCGKTTTLKMINRLIEPTSGQILVDGTNVVDQDPTQLRRSIGYVFQGIGLFPHITIEENVGMVLRLQGVSQAKRRQRSEELLDIVGLPPEQYLRRYPDELSGGQQQRVGVARALASDPSYLLMDEPFGALDPLTRDTLQQELLVLKQRLKKTIVFVTHDIFEAFTLGDQIAVLHDGVLEQLGTRTELLSHPKTEFVKSLFAKPAQYLSDFQDLVS